MTIASDEFPNALFVSPETAVAGFSLLRTSLRDDPTLYKPSDVYLLGVLRATRARGSTDATPRGGASAVRPRPRGGAEERRRTRNQEEQRR